MDLLLAPSDSRFGSRPEGAENRVRRADWPERLHAVIALHRKLPFLWGTSDCACLFRDCVAAMTGTDPLYDLAPWFSAASARRSLVRAGFATPLDLMRQRFDEIAPAMAGRGDAGFLAERDDISAPAIITGPEALSRNEHGFVVVPTGAIVIAFRI